MDAKSAESRRRTTHGRNPGRAAALPSFVVRGDLARAARPLATRGEDYPGRRRVGQADATPRAGAPPTGQDGSAMTSNCARSAPGSGAGSS